MAISAPGKLRHMASREELLRSIRPGMRIDRAFFLKVYGYEPTWPGFAEIALQRFEVLGCSVAREYYQKTVSDYDESVQPGLKEAASQYSEQLEQAWKKKVGDELRIKKRMLQILQSR